MAVDAATSDNLLSGAERTAWRFDAFVTAIAVDAGSSTAAFALGSGRIRLVDFQRQQAHAARTAEAHAGAALALIADAETGFVSGGDDGRVVRVAGDGASFELASYKGQWVEHLALAGGRVAAAVGRTVHWLDGDGGQARALGPHASTVSGLAWSAGRLAVAHYNGISLWGDADEPDRFERKGAHLAIAASPDQRFVGTATQDNSLHVWRLADKTEMRMAGYPAKIASLSWSCDSLWLAGSGVNGLTAWPFDGDGPEGREPRTFLDGKDALGTPAAFHPPAPLIAGGLHDRLPAL